MACFTLTHAEVAPTIACFMATRVLASTRTPSEVLASIACEPGAFALSVPDPVTPVTLVGCAPVAELRLASDSLDPLDEIVRFIESSPVLDPALPFPLAGGVVACLAYELGAWLVPGVPRRATGESLAVLRRYDPLLVFEHRRRTWTLVGSTSATPAWLERLDAPIPTWDRALATPE